MQKLTQLLAAVALGTAAVPAAAAEAPNDAQIAHIAYTAGNIDVAAAKLALANSRDATVREFASTMIRDHEAVNAKALDLVKALNVTPQDNPVSQSLSKSADEMLRLLESLDGAAFDDAYVANEVAFHSTVNGALEFTLIPSAKNQQLKSLLQTGLKLFREHQTHAEHLAAELK